MRTATSLVGTVFGRWTVTGRAENNAHNRVAWHCRCVCGGERDVEAMVLRSGRSKSCGCLRKEARNSGQFRANTLETFHSRVAAGDPETGCAVWLGTTLNSGYGQFLVKRRTHMAHRLAWELANGPIPAGLFVCHRCDNPPCCNPAHLFLGTAADNNADARAKKRNRVGEAHGNSKLTVAAVSEIRALRAQGWTLVAIGKRFGVKHAAIQAVLSGRSWRAQQNEISPSKQWM